MEKLKGTSCLLEKHMKRYYSKLKKTKTRFILSDVLPFELPVSISNRGFYKFLNSLENTDDLTYKEHVKELLCIYERKDAVTTIPYQFKVKTRAEKVRTISVMHPSNQNSVLNFIDQYKEAILYYSSISNFSIRRPCKIASTKYFFDNTHNLLRVGSSHWLPKVEEINKEFENLRSFFVYKDFSNVYNFYESPQYHKLEKKFRFLGRIDIASCFDSIYTHTIAWAVYEKEDVKADLNSIKTSFAGKFDSLLQRMNYSETNGILIGPELSRIFAEIILQRIDNDIEKKLEKEELIHLRDYQILRYVDDYFIFCNTEEVFNKIKKVMENCLYEYKLKMNSEKESLFSLPVITPISKAKRDIDDLLNSIFKDIGWNEAKTLYSLINFNADVIITRVKKIIDSEKIEAADIASFLLSRLERKFYSFVNRWIDECKKCCRSDSLEEKINLSKTCNKVRSLFLSIMRFCFYMLSTGMPANAFIIVSRIVMIMIIAIRKSRELQDGDCVHLFKIPDSDIYREILLNIERHINAFYSSNEVGNSIECLYLINLAAEIDGKFYLKNSTLEKIADSSDYITIVVLLRYIKTLNRYEDLRAKLIEKAKEKLNDKTTFVSTEQTLLIMDLISCPYIEISEKQIMLDNYLKALAFAKIYINITDKTELIKYIYEKQISFTNWKAHTFAKELDFKRSEFVY